MTSQAEITSEFRSDSFIISLSRSTLNPSHAEAEVLNSKAGAVLSFIGTTRDSHQGRLVSRLEYEAHEILAKKILQNLCVEAIQRFDLIKVCIYHRLGILNVGEISVVIAVSATHRAA